MKYLAILLALLVSVSEAQQLAFPGVVGYGRYSSGGRGGTVWRVNSLSGGSGSGADTTFRDALTASGARIILFKVNGIIDISEYGNIQVNNPYCTVYFNTAPGYGIQIKGGEINIRTNDVIFRGARLRHGDGVPITVVQSFDDRQSLTISHVNCRDVVIDHCSIEWGTDVSLQLFGNTYPTSQAVTIQNCIIGETFDSTAHGGGPHAFNWMMDNCDSITAYANVVVHTLGRSPRWRNDEPTAKFQYINNVTYNCGGTGGTQLGLTDNGTVDALGNYFKRGLQTGTTRGIVFSSPDNFDVWMHQNISHNRTDDSQHDSLITATDGSYSLWGSSTRTQSPENQREWYVMDEIPGVVLERAGAFPRDSIDTRIIAEVRDSTGRRKNGTYARTIYWPAGTAQTGSSGTTLVWSNTLTSDPTSGTFDGRTIELDLANDGTYERSRTITTFTANVPNSSYSTAIMSGSESLIPGTTKFRVLIPITNYSVSGRHPVYPSVTPDTDTDGDGLPNWFELALGGTSTSITLSGDHDGDGWTNVEEYGNTVNLPLPMTGIGLNR